MSWVSDWLKAHPGPKPQAKPWGGEISYSQIRAYLDCPLRYKLRYLDGMRGSWTPGSSLGISLHNTLQRFHQEKSAEKDRLLELFEDSWRSEGYSSAQEQMLWHEKGRGILEIYWAHEKDAGSDIVAVEREFLFPVASHQVRGMIDRVDRLPDGTCEIIDYKTHLEFENESELQDNLQLNMYALAARESLGLTPSRLTLYYIAAAKKVSVAYDGSEEEVLKEFLGRMGDILSSERDLAADTSFCPRCDLKNRCAQSTAKD